MGPGILASETLRSVGGILRNKDMDAFMVRYAPKMKELAPRDLVARAMENEIREGRGVYNPDHDVAHVWIDLRHLPETVHRTQIPEVTNFFKRYVNIDPQTSLCPVRPSCHYHMGGIPTDEYGAVQGSRGQTVPCLYAIGECAAASFHGFNRLGTNSILELITMGRFAGEHLLPLLKDRCPDRADSQSGLELRRIEGYLAANGSQSSGRLKNDLKQAMTAHLSVFRTADGIRQCLETLERIRREAQAIAIDNKTLILNPELLQRWELDNLMDIAEIIARAALKRKESRGAHYRDDFPERDDKFVCHHLVAMDRRGKIIFGTRAVDMRLFESSDGHSDKFGLIQRKY